MTAELATIPTESALTVYTTVNGLDPYLSKIRAELDSFKPDLTTVAGRQAIASMAYKVARSKTYLDSVGKELVDAQKEVPRKIDAERKRVRDLLDEWKDQVRAPLTQWEEAEKTRVSELQKRVDGLAAIALNLDLDNAVTLADKLEVTRNAVIDDSWQEFKAKAAEVKAQSLKTLETAHAAAQKREADEAELKRLRDEAAARLRRENEERIAREAAEKATREAEEKARRDREQAEREAKERQEAFERKAREEAEAAAKREAELKRQREQAEREKQEAAERAARAEQEAAERIARAEQAAKEKAEREQREAAEAERREAERREADKAHKGKINRAAMEALVAGGLSQDAAKQAVTLIASRKIPAVTIAY